MRVYNEKGEEIDVIVVTESCRAGLYEILRRHKIEFTTFSVADREHLRVPGLARENDLYFKWHKATDDWADSLRSPRMREMLGQKPRWDSPYYSRREVEAVFGPQRQRSK